MSDVVVRVYSTGELPAYQKPGDAGMDVCSIMSTIIEPGKAVMVHTGIHMELPEGYECQVRPRSGLALKYGITVLNSPGTIDSSYRGECNVILINHGKDIFVVEKGMRIAQFVFTRYDRAIFSEVQAPEMLAATERGTGGFGHTGT